MFSASKSKGASGSYQIANSLRFRSSASAYLNRTPGASNRTTWTISFWMKRGTLTTQQGIFGAYQGSGASDTTYFRIYFDSGSDNLAVGGGASNWLITSQVFRDPSSWYHIVLSVDTTQATSSNRIKLYINGAQVTSFSTAAYPAQNSTLAVNANWAHYVGSIPGPSNYFDGYLADINFIDGQALTPSSFGQINATTGVWQPIAYAETYGTNGFHLSFSNGTSTTTLGYDSSGNSNNWTTNNISLTAGSTYDWMIDSPTPFAGSSYGVGNYATLNPLNTNASIYNGNLSITSTSSWQNGVATMQQNSGKWYAECVIGNNLTGGSFYNELGAFIGSSPMQSNFWWIGNDASGYSVLVQPSTAYYYHNNSSVSTLSGTFASGSVMQIAIDIDAGKCWLGCDNSWIGGGNPSTATTPTFTFTANYYALIGATAFSSTGINHINFGQRPFAYTPPSGFQSLCTQNISAGTVITSGSFIGNVSTDGPFVWLNGTPTAMTINGNAVTFGTHADKLANGFKVRSSSSSYNASGSNTFSITTNSGVFKTQIAQPNP